jgi:hypothetical protein
MIKPYLKIYPESIVGIMKVQHFIIRLDPEKIQSDQNRLDSFLKNVTLKDSSTEFYEESEYWSVLIYYMEK